jgi:predicted membrane chloride channel (bestrophin family)
MDLTLISIAMIFPLVFTIRGSFRRREKALEHLSEFRGTIKTLDYFFKSNLKLTEEDNIEVSEILVKISNNLMSQLKNNSHETARLDGNIDELYEFVQRHKENISSKREEKIFRLMQDLHETIENVHAINVHRTPISLKAYCLIFIYIFPLIYAPSIIYKVGADRSVWITYFIVVLSQFILISLYNIQNQLEYPFDDKGMDDIQLDNFKIDR